MSTRPLSIHIRQGVPFDQDLERCRTFAAAIHERVLELRANGVRDDALVANLKCFLPDLPAWYEQMQKHLGNADSTSPTPYIWLIARHEFPGFADSFKLWSVENKLSEPDAPGPHVFTAVEDAALPEAVDLAVAEILRHGPDPTKPLLEWQERETRASVAAMRRLASRTVTDAAAVDRSALWSCLLYAEQEALRRAEDASDVNRPLARRFRRLSERYRSLRYRITGGPTAFERMLDESVGRMMDNL